MKQYWTAERIWPDSTIVCIGGGPSLTQKQIDYLRDRKDAGDPVRAIAVNDAYRICPWADVLYFCDDKWWSQYGHCKNLVGWQGLIVRLEGGEHDFGDKRIKVMRNIDLPPAPSKSADRKGGLSDRRDGLRTGKNSGYQAINLAVHLGAKRILLLGYDMEARVEGGRLRTHWFGDHPGGTGTRVYDVMLPWFDTLPQPLAARGIEIINCTGGGRLNVFPRRTVEQALLPRFSNDAGVDAALKVATNAAIDLVSRVANDSRPG